MSTEHQSQDILRFEIIEVKAREFNQVKADFSLILEIENCTAQDMFLRAQVCVYEVGWDDRKPGSPLTITSTDGGSLPAKSKQTHEVAISIGTPFYWTSEAPRRYSAIITCETEAVTQDMEITFSLHAPSTASQIVIEKKISPAERVVANLNPSLPSLFVVGDSTGYSNSFNQMGWGDALPRYFNLSKINILNRARPGRSTRSYRSEGLWERVLSEAKAGDYILIQFGHNDADHIDQGRCRGVLPGIGPDTREVILPDGTHETVGSFGYYLRCMIEEATFREVHSVLLSPTVKNEWSGVELSMPQGGYGDWSRAVAEHCGIPFIDLSSIVAKRYQELGPAKVQTLFCDVSDGVHTSPAGAEMNAQCVVLGLAACPQLASLKAFQLA